MLKKSYSKLMVLLVAISMIAALLSGCGAASNPPKPASSPAPAASSPAPAPAASSAAPAAKTYTFKLAHHVPATHAVNGYATEFAKLVGEKSKGQIKVEVYPGGQIGGLKDNTDALRMGTLDFAMIDLGTAATFYPASSIIGLPFFFRDLKHVEAFYASPKMQEITKDMAAKANVKFIGYAHSGMRVLLSKKPINSVDDMKGLKIRVPEVPVYVDTMKALGANPTPIPSGELYTALQHGVVEACEMPPDTLVSLKMNEVTKYVAVTNHIYTDINLAMSQKLYQSLPDDLKKAVDEASKEATANFNKLAAKLYDDNLKKLIDAGLIKTNPDVKPFAAKVQSVWAAYQKAVPEGKALMDYVSGLK